MKYNLEHLTQEIGQVVIGPIQDDEAVVLFSIIRTSGLKRVVELGGLHGYSAKNFLESVGVDGTVYSIDINNVNKISPNHITIIKSADQVVKDDIQNRVDVVFFDCHNYDCSLSFFNNMVECGIIDDETVLVLHDTNLHYVKLTDNAFHNGDGWIHAVVERDLTNYFFDIGYQVLNLDTKPEVHNELFSYRHGLSICKKFKKFNNQRIS
jgi:predicted O-methyltransferase YrrM